MNTNDRKLIPGFQDTSTLDDAEDARQMFSGLMFAALAMPERLRAARESLPLTVIGGFLGAGKTTLLSHLLGEPHGRRLMVLVNDFGRINIDAALVSSRTDDMISLTNGCACCTVSGDLTKALIEVAQRSDPPDAIVLEVSGLANPLGVVQIALANPAIRLEGVLVVADAETLHQRASEPQTSRLFLSQLAAADLVVLSKTDLLESSKLTPVQQWLSTHCPSTPVIESVGGDIPSSVVLGIASSRKVRAEPGASLEHNHNFDSVSFTIEGPLEPGRLQALLDRLPKSLLRAKGVLSLAGEPACRTVYQQVGSRWSFTTAEPWGDEVPRSTFVFIAPSGELDRATLKTQLETCCWPGDCATACSLRPEPGAGRREA
ncbi:TPA: GTP-binding protein [Pseudomonas aeruginosa]|nr:GTP-binding protein [Pseudomonas fluorescens]HBO1995408.1 GTP-binding protein [Pseudomonas aeruginosa]